MFVCSILSSFLTFRYHLLTDLLDMQMLLFAFATQALQQPVTDFKIFPVVTCIKEAYSINAFIVYLLNEIFSSMLFK